MSRRGEGLTVNTIILITLGLIILVVLVLMFSRTASKGSEGVSACEKLGGQCYMRRLSTDSDTLNRDITCESQNPPVSGYFGECPKIGDVLQTCCARRAALSAQGGNPESVITQ
jgi:hypothetical protein